jgi:PAS domain S-box-containing protein
VTELRRAEQALRQSETHLRLALDNAAMGTWDWRVGSDWIAWSEGAGKLCGLPSDTPGITLDEFYRRVHPDDRSLTRARHEERNPKSDEYSLEFRIVWDDGTVHWLERKGRAVEHDADGRPTRYLGVSADVTERKQSEAILRRLSHQLLKLQDDERRRLARDLHDSVAQDVFAITIGLAAIEETGRLRARSGEILAEAQSLAERALRELRTRAYLLHPPVLDMAGLAPSLSEYATGLARRGEFAVDISGIENVGRLPTEVETTLFRVAQEALSNVVRHAGTDRATLTLTSQRDSVELRVEDSGTGLAKDETSLEAQAMGVGIPGMRERLSQVGGTLDIATGSGWTIVTARAPVTLTAD